MEIRTVIHQVYHACMIDVPRLLMHGNTRVASPSPANHAVPLSQYAEEGEGWGIFLAAAEVLAEF